MSQRHGGYLFFDACGRIFRLRDEEILKQQDATWSPPFRSELAGSEQFFLGLDAAKGKQECIFEIVVIVLKHL
jgi:hypothetical protein